MSGLKPSNAASLAHRLFVPADRLGWQYVDPGGARDSPQLSGEPQWRPPPAPDLREVQADQADRLPSLPPRLGVAALLTGLGSLLLLIDDAAGLGGRHVLVGLLFILVAAGLVAVSMIPLSRSRARATQQVAAYERRKTYERGQRFVWSRRTVTSRWAGPASRTAGGPAPAITRRAAACGRRRAWPCCAPRTPTGAGATWSTA